MLSVRISLFCCIVWLFLRESGLLRSSAMPIYNELGIAPSDLSTSEIVIVPLCWYTDQCCWNLWPMWRLGMILFYGRFDVDISPVITSTSTRFDPMRAGLMSFDCEDVRHLDLIPDITHGEEYSVGYFFLMCPIGTTPMIIYRVPVEIKPRRLHAVYMFVDKGYCVAPLLAVFVASVLYGRRCVETQFLAWHVILGAFAVVIWTTSEDALAEIPEGRADFQQQGDVGSLEIYLSSMQRERRIKLGQAYGVSSLAWNNTLSSDFNIRNEQDRYYFQACALGAGQRVNLHLDLVLDTRLL